ncbi:MAG: MoaD/ThiS family protein [Polyangiaceae bacterium]|nr:MoaD/ThiS family protein [Polyangiaceae bacterium]
MQSLPDVETSTAGSVRLLAFAAVRDVIGAPEAELDVASCTVEELWPVLLRRYPALEPYRASIRIAVNGTYAFASDRVAPGDEVALLPPVAGG